MYVYISDPGKASLQLSRVYYPYCSCAPSDSHGGATARSIRGQEKTSNQVHTYKVSDNMYVCIYIYIYIHTYIYVYVWIYR